MKQLLTQKALESSKSIWKKTIVADEKQFTEKWEIIGRELLEYLDNYLDNSHRNLLKSGYFLPISQFGFSYIEELNELVKDNESKEIEKFILGLLKDRENIDYLYVDWTDNKYFKSRKRFIIRGVQAHLDGDYISSVPILLPHIEGIFYDFFIDLGIINPINTKKFQGNTALSLLKNIHLADNSTDKDKIYFRRFLSKIKMYDYNYTSNGFPNRGQILHGLELQYDQETWSAQIIFLLNFVLIFTKNKYKVSSRENGIIEIKIKG